MLKYKQIIFSLSNIKIHRLHPYLSLKTIKTMTLTLISSKFKNVLKSNQNNVILIYLYYFKIISF